MPIRHLLALVCLCVLSARAVHAEQIVAAFPPPEWEQREQTPPSSDAKPDAPATAAPSLEISSSLNSPQSAGLWERIRDGFALNEMDSPLVREHESWYGNRPDYVKRVVERSKRYLFHIVEEVEKRGMPTEIALLPMIESAYNPRALSPAQASGIWQFIPSTGKNYGLEQNWWYDGRRDIVAATDAALDYLQKLHEQFGSWELALAAYNCGENCVARAIARNQASGEPTDYSSLRLPAETRYYVPKLIAVRNIISNPGAFGVALADIPNQPYFTSVALNQHIDIKLAAKLADVPLDEFMALNPAYNRPVVSATSPRILLLPVDKVATFNAALENYSRPLVSWQSYSARKGEKIDAIAKKFGTTVSRLKANNHIAIKRNRLSASQLLLVPLRNNEKTEIAPDTVADAAPDQREEAATSKTHVVKKGDTLFSVARRYGMTAKQLKAINSLKSNHLVLGSKLSVAGKVAIKEKVAPKRATLATKSPAGKRTLYTVRRGDTLSSIARRFKVAANDIQRWNNLGSRQNLTRGTKVTLYLAKKG